MAPSTVPAMSRLDSAIRRLQAQRDCIDWAAGQLAGAPGNILEVGLGNGRTYDHLRERFPGNEIFVFDRRIAAHPDCVPSQDHMFIGDVLDTLPAALARLGRHSVLVHSDIGTGNVERNKRLAARIAPLVAPLLVPGAIVLSDQPMFQSGWVDVALPAGVQPERYHIYRA